jgi:hypothetical protein
MQSGFILVLLVMDINVAVRSIESALERNPNCTAGLLTRNRVVGIQKGPSGGEEILALLYADDPWFGYWYGHVLRHPKNREVFVSLLVWSDKLPNASTVPLFFRRFHYWVNDRVVYHPCTIQNYDDAYQEDISLEAASGNLARMISLFEIGRRRGDEHGPYADDPAELRILSVYSVTAACDRQGFFPAIPMPVSLSVVGSPA